MIIDRLYRNSNQVVIVIRGREDYQPAFDLRLLPNPEQLVTMLKAKLADIGQPTLSPPDDPLAQKFAQLKTALQGLDIGD